MKRERILIAAANWTMLWFLDAGLTKSGYDIESSWNGKDIMRKMEEFNPDLVILDAHMQGLNCPWFCTHIKGHKLGRQVIVLADHDTPKEQLQELELKADACMTKPIEYKNLLFNIKLLLERRREKETFYDFMRMLSHEVGNKMQTVASISQILSDENRAMDNDRKGRFLKSINRAAAQTSELIQEMQTLINVEAGDIVLNAEPMHMSGIIADLIKPYKEDERYNGLGFDMNMEGNIPELELDHAAVKQILRNIIGNAVKYGGESGDIHIAVKTDGGYVDVVIRDNGCGIPMDELPHIFKKGFRASNALDGYNGSGIGLYTVKMLLDRMGGRIDVKSEQGKGSEFVVSFPYRRGLSPI